MAKTDNVMPIPVEGINKNLPNIDGWLKEVAFVPTGAKDRVGSMSPDLQKMFAQYVTATGGTNGEKMSIFETLKRFSDGSPILSIHSAKVINTIKFGFSLGICVMDQYEKASGLTNLRELNKAGKLTGEDINRFQQGQMTSAAVELFASAYFIVWELTKYQTDEMAGRVLPAIQLPEFSIINAQQAIKLALFYFGKFASSERMVSDDIALVKFTIEYFNSILKELDVYKSSLRYTEEFENRSYKLDKTDFVIHGFTPELSGRVQNVEFKRVLFSEVVGNADSKHDAQRLVQTLMCYDPKEQRNVMMELGGLADVSLYEGPPGTGKSMLIGAISTRLYDMCNELGHTFMYWPFPPNPVSEYQGGSAERVLAFFKVLQNPGVIFYAPIDDAENNLVSRGSRSISSGNREVISIFLTATEGAGAIKRGNYALQLFTNRPEDLDAAVLSRIQKRSRMDGAVTWEDFMDQDYGWWKRYNTYKEGFIDLSPAETYQYFEKQKDVASMGALYTASKGDIELMPQNETVRKIFLEVSKKYNPKKQDQFFGLFYEAVKKSFPFFTSRDIRNIQKNIDTRIMDFDFPVEWMNDNANFFAKKCDEKKAMLIEQMQENMGDISFAEMRTQEAIKYIDITVRINETKFETSVREHLEQMRVQAEATKRFKAALSQQS